VAICDSAIRLCAIRATRLDDVGNPQAVPNNVYVSDSPLTISVTPDTLTGERRNSIGGCDCVVATYRGKDKMLGFTLEFDVSKIEPGLMELMLGATPIPGPGTSTDDIGWWWPQRTFCDDAESPNVCLEGWQNLWEDDHPDPTYPYLHWIWPSTFWSIGPHTLNVEFLQPRFNGFTRGNPNWGLGIFDDLPEECEPQGGAWYDTSIPTARCGLQTVSVT
jgi:hypothetical protein